MQEGSPWILTRISVFWGCFAVGRSDRSFGKKASLGKIDRPPSKVSCWLLSVYVNQVICNSADLRLRCFSVTLPVSLCLRDLAEKVYRRLVYRDAGSVALGKGPNRFRTRLAFPPLASIFPISSIENYKVHSAVNALNSFHRYFLTSFETSRSYNASVESIASKDVPRDW